MLWAVVTDEGSEGQGAWSEWTRDVGWRENE